MKLEDRLRAFETPHVVESGLESVRIWQLEAEKKLLLRALRLAIDQRNKWWAEGDYYGPDLRSTDDAAILAVMEGKDLISV